MREKIQYYMLSETTVDPDVNKKRFKVLNENTSNLGGVSVTTLNYDTILQSCSTKTKNVKNRNGRDYPLQVVWGNIQTNPLVQHDLKMGTLGGEYGHPDLGAIISKEEKLHRQLTIDPKMVCIHINKMWVEDNLIMGNCTTVPGGWGDVLRNRIIAGLPPMASSRAIGGTDSRGVVIANTYGFITSDSVYRPGHADAYMVPETAKLQDFALATQGAANSMNECAVGFNLKDESFGKFILSESINKQRMDQFCSCLGFDYSTLKLNESGMTMQRVSDDGLHVDTLYVPMKKLIGAEYHNLF